jgi:GNAT superfamily N-acetyltransferase
MTDKDRASLAELSGAVYPPDVAAAWPGRSIEWAARHWSVMVWDDDQTLVLAHAGVLDRNARLNQANVKIGGIGGVMTHPAFRKQGIATAAIDRCIDFFRGQGDVDFALLVCDSNLIPFYDRLGWQQFLGRLLVNQRGQTTEFTFNLPMIYRIRCQSEFGGIIDLQGPPW